MRSPVDERFPERVHGDVIGKPAVGEHQVGRAVAVQVRHGDRHPTLRGQFGSSFGTVPLGAAPVDIRVQVRAGTVEIIHYDQFRVAVAIQVGGGNGLGAIGGKLAAALAAVAVASPVEEQVGLFVVLVRVGENEVNRAVVI